MYRIIFKLEKLMKSQIFIWLFILNIFLCFSFYPKKDVKTKYNGIYLIVEKGKEFSLINQQQVKVAVDSVPIISILDFEKVRMTYINYPNYPELDIQLTKKGKLKFAKVTSENIGKSLAIIIDNKLLSLATVQTEIPNGKIGISGLDKKQIEEIVKRFKN